MNKNIGLQLIVYGLLLAGLSYLAYYLAPALSRPALIAGLAGATLCCIWGLRGMLGKGGKALSILTLTAISFVMLSQAVVTWGAESQTIPERRTVAILITVLFVLSVGVLMRIAYAGVTARGQRKE